MPKASKEKDMGVSPSPVDQEVWGSVLLPERGSGAEPRPKTGLVNLELERPWPSDGDKFDIFLTFLRHTHIHIRSY